MKGISTGRAPIQVNKIVIAKRHQNIVCLTGYILNPKNFELFRNGINTKIKIDMIKAITPPNLLGMDRRIAYANKKYHSG